MVFPFHLVNDKFKDRNAERRAYGRRLQESLRSSLGAVLDISRGGMRVQCRKPCEGEHEVTLDTCEGDITLQARVCWFKKTGFRKYEMGLEFVDVDAETAAKLAIISTLHQFAYGKAG